MALLKVPVVDHVTKLPPLTDDEVRACEAEFGVRFPSSLISLLKEQNGGYLENSDFKIAGHHFGVSDIFGISTTSKWGRIHPLSQQLDPDWFSQEDMAELRNKLGDPARLLVIGGDGHYQLALDYTRLTHEGEPTLLSFIIEGTEATGKTIASSFSELLAAQYAGDPQADVRLEEADRLPLIAAGGYEGVRPETPGPLRHQWKICDGGDEIIVLSSDDHGWGVTLNRYAMRKDALVLEAGRMEDLEEEVESELAALIQPMIESPLISQFAEGLKPVCYQLHLPIDPNNPPDEGWVKLCSSQASGLLWKNINSQVVYAVVYSSSRVELEQALVAMRRTCSQT